MDDKDLELLRILEENSRLSAQEIGSMTNLIPAEVEARIHALEENRIIRKYTTVINWEKAGNGEVSAIIELKVSPERDFGYDRIAERLSRFRQVRTLRLITGTVRSSGYGEREEYAGGFPVCVGARRPDGPDPRDGDPHRHEVLQGEWQYPL